MSSGYSANQYDSAFRSQRLQNWCDVKPFKQRPTAQVGHTAFIADDRGHLLPGVVKRGSAWPDFKGPWDLPARIPAHPINPTARSVDGLSRLRSWGFDPQHTGRAQPHRGTRSTGGLQDTGELTTGDIQQDAAAAGAGSAPPVTGSERATSQNQDSQAAVGGSSDEAAERAPQATGEDRPQSKPSAAEEKPPSRPGAGEGTHSRPGTGQSKPGSSVSQKAARQAAPSSSNQTR